MERVELQGNWSGTFYQDNVQRGYPMELAVEPAPSGFSVKLTWPTLNGSQTVGSGHEEKGHIYWTETKLVSGANIALDGRYIAAFLDDHTLAGRYEHDYDGTGFFLLSRSQPQATQTGARPATASSQPAGVIVAATVQSTKSGPAPNQIGNADSAWQDHRRLKVLYAGWKGGSRERAFMEFLGQWFDHVGDIALGELSMETAAAYDVVVADWGSMYGNDGYPASAHGTLNTPSLTLGSEFTKPIIAMDFLSSTLRPQYKLDWL